MKIDKRLIQVNKLLAKKELELEELKDVITEINKEIQNYKDNYTEIIKDKCFKCGEHIIYTEVFSYCSYCLECQ